MDQPYFLLILALGLGLLLFMNFRTRKAQQKRLSFRDSLVEGQQVQTIGGLIGTIVSVDGDVITLESGPGTQLKFVKAALARLIEDEPADDAAEDVATDVDSQDPVEQSEAGSTIATDTSTEDPGDARGFEARDETKDIRRHDTI